MIGIKAERARAVGQQIMQLEPYLSTEIVDYLSDVEEYGFFRAYQLTKSVASLDTAFELKVTRTLEELFAASLFDYLQVVDRLDRYRRQFLPEVPPRPRFLISPADSSSPIESSDAVPLRDRFRE